MIKVVCGSSIINDPWTPSPLVSRVSSLRHHPHQFLQLMSLRKFLWTPLLMEAAFAVASRHDGLAFPVPRLHWVMVKLGTASGKVVQGVCMVRAGHAQGKHSP